MRQIREDKLIAGFHNFLDVCDRHALVDVLELLAEVCQHLSLSLSADERSLLRRKFYGQAVDIAHHR